MESKSNLNNKKINFKGKFNSFDIENLESISLELEQARKNLKLTIDKLLETSKKNNESLKLFLETKRTVSQNTLKLMVPTIDENVIILKKIYMIIIEKDMIYFIQI